MTTWVFGYGSLVWRCGFNHVESVPCYVRDYARVWTQGSTDHRGTPELPGRTVTLEPRTGAKTWGTAYLLPKDEEKEIIEYLEYREKQYDSRVNLDLFTDNAETPVVTSARVYIATSASETYMGVASVDALAKQIAFAKGPSGENCEYLYRLADKMREMDVQDAELFELETKVKAIKEVLSIGYSVYDS
eukprot:CAMPEP_0118923548 /NCGR_PEP_ID=MMETSP1169-20130426/2029_1 /TAXON_ID=36882 /ORGANISM="Pyramimonas obovata, Strain CCMP722" /LENGTH=188 /DNA_ID=CAMNT_0006864555 /DNA_START=35 /DNA_END=601 /DNA_ORIENTATION=+